MFQSSIAETEGCDPEIGPQAREFTERVMTSIAALSGQFSFIRADVSQWDECIEVARRTVAEHGRVD